MLLDTALCAQWKGLCNLTPAVAGIAHLLQSLLFTCRPGGIGATFLRDRSAQLLRLDVGFVTASRNAQAYIAAAAWLTGHHASWLLLLHRVAG